MNIAAILAGGTGQRMGEKTPKQFIEVNGIPIIVRTLLAFNSHERIDHILVVCLEEWHDKLTELVRKYGLNKVKYMINPGNTRRESSLNAVEALKHVCKDDDVLLIHDAARPNVSKSIISESIEKAKLTGACETVVPVCDTIVMSTDGLYSHEIPPREKLYSVQTPQSFLYSFIRDAHLFYIDKLSTGDCVPNITDDAGLLLFSNKRVALVKGDKLNIKVTSPEDIVLLKAILTE